MSRLTAIRTALEVAAVSLFAGIHSTVLSRSARVHEQPSPYSLAGTGACFVKPWLANPYYTFALDPARATGASGLVKVRFSDSPFGLQMTPDGHYTYSLDIATTGLSKPDAGSYVVWATPPSLNPVLRLGSLSSDGHLSAQVDLNKFILIVSIETSPATKRWTEPIMLRGISRSSLMHSFMGHGPLEGPC